jgi:hypothetical protein
MGTNYRYYLRTYRCEALKRVGIKEIKENYSLIIRLTEISRLVDYSISSEELEENLGWRHEPNQPNQPYHILKKEHIDILEAIINGDIKTIEKINSTGCCFGFYKEMPLRLAIKYEHAEIVLYLINSKQTNKDIGELLGRFGSGKLFDAIITKIHTDNLPISTILRYTNEGEVYTYALRHKNLHLLNHLKSLI